MAFSSNRAPLSEIQRNFTFSTEKPRVGVKAAASGGTPPPPTLTTEDLLLQGDESWSGSFGNATQKQQPSSKKDDLAPPVLLATPVASATPVIAPLPPKHTAFAARPPARRSRNSSFMDIITWTDPVKSAIVFVAGCVALAVVDYILNGDHNISVVSWISSGALALLSGHFLGSLFNDKHREVFGLCSPARLQALQRGMSIALERAAHMHDRLMISENPRTSLKMALALWAVSFIGNHFQIWTLVVLSYVSMFMLPLAWNAYGKNLRSAASRARDEFHNRVALMGLSRAHAVGIQLLLLVSLWLNSSLATRLISLVVGTIAIRCQLAPNEVESIRATAEPYTMSVKKTASRVSRYIGTYSASKFHEQ